MAYNSTDNEHGWPAWIPGEPEPEPVRSCDRCGADLRPKRWIYSRQTGARYCWPGEGCNRSTHEHGTGDPRPWPEGDAGSTIPRELDPRTISEERAQGIARACRVPETETDVDPAAVAELEDAIGRSWGDTRAEYERQRARLTETETTEGRLF